MSKGQGGKHTNKNLTEPSWYRSRFTRNWQRTQRGDRLFNPRWSNQVMSCRWADQAAAPPNLDETNTRGHKRQGTKKAGERSAKTVHNTKKCPHFGSRISMVVFGIQYLANPRTHTHTHKAVNSNCEKCKVLSLRWSRICNHACSFVHTYVGQEYIFAASCSRWLQGGKTSSIWNTTNDYMISLSVLLFCVHLLQKDVYLMLHYSFGKNILALFKILVQFVDVWWTILALQAVEGTFFYYKCCVLNTCKCAKMMADGACARILISEQALFKQEDIWWAPLFWHEQLRPQKPLLTCSSAIHSTAFEMLPFISAERKRASNVSRNQMPPYEEHLEGFFCVRVFVFSSSALVKEQTNSRSADRAIGGWLIFAPAARVHEVICS